MAEKKLSDIDKQIEVADGTMTEAEAAAPEYTPLYRPYPDSKIPVSKSTGAFWGQRHKEGIAYLENTKTKDRWDEAIRYYQNDQGGRTGKRSDLAGVSTGSDHVEKHGTENIVFANVSALVPATYAKNPDIELTANDQQNEGRAALYERLVEELFSRKISPGIHLKNKMKRAIVTAMLTNVAYLEISYVRKEDSSEEALNELENLSQMLLKAKDVNEVAEIEGQLQALEHRVNLLGDAGPRIRNRAPGTVIVDHNCEDLGDLSEASYIIYDDYLRTSFLKAMYGTKNEQGDWVSVYEPTHIIAASHTDSLGHDDEINNFTLIGDDKDYKKYGYSSEEEYENACYTRVWYVWDKTTRRVLMFHDKDWSWPIWVWDDPYKLTRFFPIFPLTFYTDPVDRYGRSEVMYYLDQQDEINTIAHERARMRHWVMTKVFVNTNVWKDVTKVQNFLSATSNETVMGMDWPENTDVSKAVGTIAPPSASYEGLFTAEPILQAVNRISSVTPIMQSEQFKTNTTNKAIESYESTTQTRLDEKIDAIEDCIADIGTALIEMCMQFMPPEQVRTLVGETVFQNGSFENIENPQVFHEQFSFKIVGGSTLKPTSKVKKEQAIQLGQVLGQFAQANPAVVMVMLKMIARAFNEDVTITPEEWALINQSMENAIAGQQQGAGDEQQILEQAMAQVEELFNSLDEQTRVQVAQAIAQGTPLKQIVQSLIGGQGPQT